MTEYKEMIEVLEIIISSNNQTIKFLKDTKTQEKGIELYQKLNEALSKAITLAKAFDNVESVLGEKKETKECDSFCSKYHPMLTHGCDCDETSNNVGYNEMHDIATAQKVKDDIKIKVFEEELRMIRLSAGDDYGDKLTELIPFLKTENAKIKQELDICKFKFIAESENLKTVQQQLQTIKDNLNSKELKEFIWERCEADDNRVKEIISFIRQKVTGDK